MISSIHSGKNAILLLLLLASSGAAQELTEAQAMRLLRESPSVSEYRENLDPMRAVRPWQPPRPGASLNASFEGAGRTEFYFIEQEIVFNRRSGLARKLDELEADSREARANFETGRMAARMLAAFYRLVYAQQRKQVIAANNVELEDIHRAVEALHAAGEASKFDVFRAEKSIAELDVSSSDTEILAAQAKAVLAGLLGDQVNAGTLRAKGSLLPVRDLMPLREALSVALAGRADIRAAAAKLESSRLEASAATPGWKPNLKLQGGIKRAEVVDRLVVGPYVAVSVPVPLWPGRPSGEPAASTEHVHLREQLRTLRNRVLAEVQAAHDTFRIRRTAADDYRRRVFAPAQELRMSTFAVYRNDASIALEALDSVPAIQAAEFRFLELQVAAKEAEVELERVLGEIAL
ncbi:MAG: TolC family protein [Bryobacterales bacterium]|nr:TolC family protein [Bryobacterales bacterium]MDE0296518.1 TolC family protein [Bryobacterales bacterium]